MFLKDRDPLNYPASQPNPLSYEDLNVPSWVVDGIDEGILELSDDEEALQAQVESEPDEDEEIEPENQYDPGFDEVDGRLTVKEELGFSPL